MSKYSSDLLIIGGGPAGLSAAINGASEGLVVRLMDNGLALGGQAKESSAIENYPGFPSGITGERLTNAFVQQARKFNTQFHCPVAIRRLVVDGNHIVAIDDDREEYVSKAVLLSNGLSYRRLNADNLDMLIGRGCFYGVPAARSYNRECHIFVVGGANSAGQAALHLASSGRTKVKMVIRRNIEAQMSTYLVTAIRKTENIELLEGAEVVSCDGKSYLTGITIRQDDKETSMRADFVFIFIGAVPKTAWLDGTIDLDDKFFVKSWADASAKFPYQTSVDGVFAAGDVRLGSTKRVAAAIGEGAAALQMIHGYLASR